MFIDAPLEGPRRVYRQQHPVRLPHGGGHHETDLRQRAGAVPTFQPFTVQPTLTVAERERAGGVSAIEERFSALRSHKRICPSTRLAFVIFILTSIILGILAINNNFCFRNCAPRKAEMTQLEILSLADKIVEASPTNKTWVYETTIAHVTNSTLLSRALKLYAQLKQSNNEISSLLPAQPFLRQFNQNSPDQGEEAPLTSAIQSTLQYIQDLNFTLTQIRHQSSACLAEVTQSLKKTDISRRTSYVNRCIYGDPRDRKKKNQLRGLACQAALRLSEDESRRLGRQWRIDHS